MTVSNNSTVNDVFIRKDNSPSSLPPSSCVVTVSVPARVSVGEGDSGGMVRVCATLTGGSADTVIDTAINVTLATSDSPPG